MLIWQPITTAPLSWKGSYSEPERVLVWGERCGVQMGCVHVYLDGHRSATAEGYHGDWGITHWMPLPQPPKE